MWKSVLVGGMVCLLAAGAADDASAVCVLEANVSATPSADPQRPAWTYTLVIDWTYILPTVNHWALILDHEGGTCTCDQVQAAIVFDDLIGWTTGTPDGCVIDYQGVFQCAGDPGTDLDGLVLTFVPTTADCETGSTGSGTFVFYSDQAPVPLGSDGWFSFVTDAYQDCGAPLTGVFPAIPCDPTSSEPTNWSTIKALYR